MINKKGSFFWLGYCALFTLILVWERVQASRTAYVLSKMQNEMNVKQAKLQHLKFEILQIKSPVSLELAAAKRLNMSLPQPDKIISLANEKSSDFCGDNNGCLQQNVSKNNIKMDMRHVMSVKTAAGFLANINKTQSRILNIFEQKNAQN